MTRKHGRRDLNSGERNDLLATLKARFEEHTHRHQGLNWNEVEKKLSAHPEKLWSLREMERTGGEPDVVRSERESRSERRSSVVVFFDCSTESPVGRRSLCYDRDGLESRKEHRPLNSVIDMATTMGVDLLTEEQYRELQELGEFDLKTSSWVKTPDPIRRLGGALFCDRRYGHVFVYHNGAQSYYAARGFRAALMVEL